MVNRSTLPNYDADDHSQDQVKIDDDHGRNVDALTGLSVKEKESESESFKLPGIFKPDVDEDIMKSIDHEKVSSSKKHSMKIDTIREENSDETPKATN